MFSDDIFIKKSSSFGEAFLLLVNNMNVLFATATSILGSKDTLTFINAFRIVLDFFEAKVRSGEETISTKEKDISELFTDFNFDNIN